MNTEKVIPKLGPGQASREESLQKIIKNQELVIRDLERKINTTATSGFPEKARYENEIIRLQKEVEFLGKKIIEMQTSTSQEKTSLQETIERLRASNESMKASVQREKGDIEKKMFALEETYKNKIDSLEGQISVYEEELSRLRSLTSQDPYERAIKETGKFSTITEELSKIAEVFTRRENEYKAVITHLESKYVKSFDLAYMLTL